MQRNAIGEFGVVNLVRQVGERRDRITPTSLRGKGHLDPKLSGALHPLHSLFQ
jgi:hypothetical protein